MDLHKLKCFTSIFQLTTRLAVARTILVCFLFSADSSAFVRSRSISGVPVFWSNPVVPISVNPSNSSGLSENEIQHAFQSSFKQWTRSNTRAGISYIQSTATPPKSGHDGRNTIYFASEGNRRLGVGVVALTEVSYFVNTGMIVGVDMVFNDKKFLFTMAKGDTGAKVDDMDTKIYLPDVATHEVGHAFGFDHSNVHNSSLIFMAFNGQFQTGKDDIRGMHDVFDVEAGSRQGTASGQVVGLNGGIFGAHVNAINLKSAKIEGATLSGSDGRFTITKLPPGDYSFLVEPYLTSPTIISPFYANISHRFCSGAYFARTFYSACGSEGRASSISINNSSVDLGVISPSCERMENAASDTSDEIVYEVDEAGGAFFNPLSVDQTHYFHLRNVSGEIAVRAMSYTIFSPIDVEVDILFSDGNSIPTSSSVDDVQTSMPGGLTNFDSQAEAWSLAHNDYLVRVRSKSDFLWTFLFPAGWHLVDRAGYYFLSIAVNNAIPETGPQDMSTCKNVPNVLQSGLTFGVSTPSTANEDSRLGSGCASVSTNTTPSDPGNPLESPLVLTILVALLTKILAQLRPAVAGSSRRR